MRNTIAFILMIFNFCGSHAQKNNYHLQLVEVQKIWDRAPHNAFTDLINYNDQWFCVFREGSKHVSNDGALRIITSKDGKKWESAALITSENADLRDAKITLTPDGKLMLSGAGALHDKLKNTHQSLVWFSDDGLNWSEAFNIGDPNFWLWRTTWHKNEAYNFGYGCGENKMLRLYKSKDGKQFEAHVEDLGISGYPNETSLVFKKDTAFCLLRCDGDNNNGMIGTSMPPYNKWNWQDLGVRIGGPHMISLNDGQFLAAVRLYKTDKLHPTRTSLCKLDPKKGEINELLTLPSGGDTSYPGMVLRDSILWVSYYSSHEEKTSIYLARIKIKNYDNHSSGKIIRTIPNNANQGVAVGEKYYYAISNTEISKHDKITNKMVASWKADTTKKGFEHFMHMNSGTVINEKLYVAHSRYKVDPNANTIEIFTIKDQLLQHEKSIPMPRKHGSLTWIDKHPDGSWWMCYAVYGEKLNKQTKLVKYQHKNKKFIEIRNWTFPEEVTGMWGDMSCSGGSWGPDGLLYTTGHDHNKAFVLKINESDELQYVRTENNVGFYGQAISWDRFSNKIELWGIVKRKWIAITKF